jgi:hypothetical protein
MEISVELSALAVLCLYIGLLIGQETRWVPQPVRTRWWRENHAPGGNRKPVVQLVASHRKAQGIKWSWKMIYLLAELRPPFQIDTLCYCHCCDGMRLCLCGTENLASLSYIMLLLYYSTVLPVLAASNSYCILIFLQLLWILILYRRADYPINTNPCLHSLWRKFENESQFSLM